MAKEKFTGTIEDFQIRSEPFGQTSRQVMTFRLIRLDKKTNEPLPIIPVVMRCYDFNGFVSEGDVVTLETEWKIGEVAEIKELYNEITNVVVKCKKL